MSAKPAKKSAKKEAGATAAPAMTAVPASGSTSGAGAAVRVEGGATSWIDSTDPRKRRWGKIVLAAVWIYVAALWLLALDQTFHWGIFGPKIPVVP